MKTKSVSQLLILISAMALYTACRKDYNFTPAPVVVPPVGTYYISFSGRIVQMIFNAPNSCATKSGCHGSGLSPDLKPANAYTSLFVLAISGIPVDTVANKTNPANNLLYQKVKPGGSMNNKLPNPSDADSILLWLNQGARNN